MFKKHHVSQRHLFSESVKAEVPVLRSVFSDIMTTFTCLFNSSFYLIELNKWTGLCTTKIALLPLEDFVTEDRYIAPALGGAATLKPYFFNTLLTSEDHPTPLASHFVPLRLFPPYSPLPKSGFRRICLYDGQAPSLLPSRPGTHHLLSCPQP